jgi:hypothetical protein
MSLSIDCQGTSAANSLTAVRIKGDRIPARFRQTLVYNIEHLEKGGVRGDIGRFVGDEFSRRTPVSLSPYFKFEIHYLWEGPLFERAVVKIGALGDRALPLGLFTCSSFA